MFVYVPAEPDSVSLGGCRLRQPCSLRNRHWTSGSCLQNPLSLLHFGRPLIDVRNIQGWPKVLLRPALQPFQVGPAEERLQFRIHQHAVIKCLNHRADGRRPPQSFLSTFALTSLQQYPVMFPLRIDDEQQREHAVRLHDQLARQTGLSNRPDDCLVSLDSRLVLFLGHLGRPEIQKMSSDMPRVPSDVTKK